MHIDHITLRTADPDATKDFLVSIFDLEVGERPAVIAASIPGYWLYFKDQPLIHIINSPARYQTAHDLSAEAIDHTAFFLEGYDAFRQKLNTLNIPFTPMDLPDIHERRIFLRTPTNILLETVFRS